MTGDTQPVTSFPVVVGDRPVVLVLGSMPGRASLDATEYYAHPRNAFWPIVAGELGTQPSTSYDERIAALAEAGIALWDVCHRCVRPGSLDSAIDDSSVEPNEIPELLRSHPTIAQIFFNGAAAEKLYRKFVEPRYGGVEAPVAMRLPSTSPANAGMSLEAKRRAWSVVFEAARELGSPSAGESE